MYTFVLETMS